MHKYRLISKKGEGTFSEVLKAQSIKSGKYVAIKCMKNHFDSIDQVNNLREIQALRRLAGHPNIIKLHEVLYDEPTGRLALVFELMDMNLYEAIKGRRHYLPEDKVRQYMYELLKALDHMHRNGIFHRDVKPENLLLLDDEIKLADLGSCRGIYSRQPYTEYISTRWYRAPECLLTDGYYNFKMDLFAAGCVWFEIVALFPLFPGQNEMDQIQKIHNVLGSPDAELLNKKFKRNASHMDFNFPDKKGTGIERLVPHADPDLIELMKRLIRYDPDERILARQALKDPYFRELRDTEKERSMANSAPLGQVERTSRSNTGGNRSQTDLRNGKIGMSASSSTASMGYDESPEATNAPSRSTTPTFPPWETQDNTSSLPKIRQDRRKAERGHETSPSEGEDAEDAPLLPPIAAGSKGKRDEKNDKKQAKKGAFKAAANASLQKPAVMQASHSTGPQSMSNSLGVQGTSKGFSGSLSGVIGGGPSTISGSSAGASGMSSSYAQNWTGGTSKDNQEHSRSTMGSPSATAAERMSSTWAPNQSRKYVSPFSHKLPKEASQGKKR